MESEKKGDEPDDRDAERFHALVRATSDIVYTVNADFSVMKPFDGRGIVESLGFPCSDWMKRYLPEFEHDRVGRAIREAVSTRTSLIVQHQFVRPDGSLGWGSSRAEPIYDEHGEIVEWIGVCTDVTHRRRSEESARLSQERLRLAAATARFGFYNADLETGEIFWSDEMRVILGASGEDAHSTSAKSLDFIHPDDRARVQATFLASQDPHGDGIFEDEHRILRPDGSIRWVLVKGSTHFEGGREGNRRRPVRSTGVVLDVTQKKLAEESLRIQEERYRLLAEANPVGIIHGTADGAVRFCNDAFCRLTGYSRIEFESGAVGWTDITPPEWLHKDWAAVAEAREKGFCSPYEKEYFRKDGTRVPVVVGFALFGRELEESAAFILDVSAQKRAEAEQQRLVDELREADRKKNEFLAMLAHELRNPLAAVSNAAVMLRISDEPEDVDFAKDVVERQTRQLGRLIEDLLDVSRIATGKVRLKLAPCDAGIILRRAIESVQPLVDQRGHRLDAEIDPGPLPLFADPARVEQVAVNLLNNAAKYSDDGSRIRLRAGREDDQIVMVFEDHGVGIAPEKIPSMFELFSQGDRSLARSEGGLGIGLTVVQKIVEMHGGTVAATSEGHGRGCTFTVRLPAVAAASPHAPEEDAAAQPRRRGTRVLVVDDNVDTAAGLTRLLTAAGCDVRMAHDGPTAIDAARAHRPNVVALDIGLPGMDGYEVARRLRSDETSASAVIIAVTGYGQDEDRRRSREAGFDHHLVKPVDVDRFLSLVLRPA